MKTSRCICLFLISIITTAAAAVVLYFAFLGLGKDGPLTNPIDRQGGSHPHISRIEDFWYLTKSTPWLDPPELHITKAKTIQGLKHGKTKKFKMDSFFDTRPYSLAAPELHHINGVSYVYFTEVAGIGRLDEFPFVFTGGPDPFDGYNNMTQLSNELGQDGTIAPFSNNTVWSNQFIFACRRNDTQAICTAPLNSPTQIGESSVIAWPTESWETSHPMSIEDPAAIYNGTMYLTYSLNSYCGDERKLGLGLLTWDGMGDPTLESSWNKTGPYFLAGNGSFIPIHNSYFTSPDGNETWTVYEAADNEQDVCDSEHDFVVQKIE